MQADDPVKSQMQIGNIVIASVRGRNSQYIGRTWRDYKQAVEKLGIRDDDMVSIRMNGLVRGTGWIERAVGESGVIVVREVLR